MSSSLSSSGPFGFAPGAVFGQRLKALSEAIFGERPRITPATSTVEVPTTNPEFKLGQRIVRSVQVSGMKRSYTMYTPRLQQGNQPHPVLFAFHPGGAAAKFMEENAPFHLSAKAESFVVVYPEGYGRSFNAGECCGDALVEDIDDVAFFEAMMLDINTVVSIRDKAYITGFSNGSMLSYRLMCDAPERIAAAVPYASAISMDTCVEGYQIPVMYLNGGADTLTLTGGEGVANPMFPDAIKALVKPYEALDVIAQRNGCEVRHAATAGLPAMDASCEAYMGCAVNAPVSMCIIPNLGHAWPGSGDALAAGTARSTKISEKMGPYRPELDSTGPIVDFFLKY